MLGADRCILFTLMFLYATANVKDFTVHFNSTLKIDVNDVVLNFMFIDSSQKMAGLKAPRFNLDSQ